MRRVADAVCGYGFPVGGGSDVAGDLEDGVERWAVAGILPVAEHPAHELFAEFVLRCLRPAGQVRPVISPQ